MPHLCFIVLKLFDNQKSRPNNHNFQAQNSGKPSILERHLPSQSIRKVSITMAESQEERQKRDDQIRDTIMTKLVETGEKDRLKDMLRDRLIQAGWRDELKEYCKEVIRKKGLEKVTVEELVSEITPHGRSKIPEEVKAELLKRIRFFLQST